MPFGALKVSAMEFVEEALRERKAIVASATATIDR
jgi:hypothetical protein